MSVQPPSSTAPPAGYIRLGELLFYNFFCLYIQIKDEIIHNITQMHHIKL